MQLHSPAFQDGSTIPTRYTQFDADINPPLTWDEVPVGTASFAIVVEDPDVPAAAGVPVWIHWVAFNVPSTVRDIPEAWIVEGTSGIGTRGKSVYSGPKPPDREHRYFFRLYALDRMLSLAPGATRDELVEAMRGHILGETALMGRMAPMQGP